MPDIADQLDAAIGAAPADAPGLDGTLVLGRRALRRRRLAYAAGAAATAVVVGGTAWAASPDDSAARRSEVPAFVDQPSTPATPPPPTHATSDEEPTVDWLGEDAVMLDGSGGLMVKTGWTVVRRIDKVNGPGTIGVDVSKGRRHQWFLFGKSMIISSLHAPSEGYATFQEWIDVNGPLLESRPQGGDRGGDQGEWPGEPRDDLVRFGSGESLVAQDGVSILEQRPSPDVGDSFATAADTSAVAVVVADGKRWYVLARHLSGSPAEYIAVRQSDGGPDLDAFLTFARERYAEGGGGLL